MVFHDIVSDMLNNKKLNEIVNDLCIRYKKLNFSLVFLHSFNCLYEKMLN